MPDNDFDDFEPNDKAQLLFDLFCRHQQIDALKKELTQLNSEALEIEKKLSTLRAFHDWTFIRTPQLDSEGVFAQVSNLQAEDEHSISFIRFQSLT